MSKKFAMSVARGDMDVDEVILCYGNKEKHLYARATGKWSLLGDMMICSNCLATFKLDVKFHQYCGICGAKMEGEKE